MLKIFSPLSQFDIFGLIFFFFGKTTFVITNLGITIFVIILIGILFFYIFYKKRNKFINKNYQIFFESIFIFVYKVVYEQIGKDGLIYFPFIFSLFVFILLLNLFSIIPMSFAVTSHLIWTLYFSLSICLGIFFIGILKHKIHFFKLFVPEVPLFLYPIMIVIEILSYIIRSFSLAIRLSANIISGHILVHILADFVFVLCNLKIALIFFPFILLLAIFVLEIGVACLQAYIFIVLICMYLNDSIHLNAH